MTWPSSRSTWPTAGLLLAVLLLVPAGAAQATLEGTFTASSVDAEPASVSAATYLLGMRTNSSRDMHSQWVFDAAEVEVRLTIEEGTRAGVVWLPDDRRTDTTVHTKAHGVLLETHAQAYLVAQASKPWDPDSTIELQTTLPDARMAPAARFSFDTEYFTANEQVPEEDDLYQYHVEQDWPILGYALPSPTEPVILRGDFRIVVFGTDFRIQSAEGTANYETGYLGYDRMDAGMPIVEESNFTRAELVFRNATFTLYPERWPVDLFISEATIDIRGSGRFHDADGALRLQGQGTELRDSLVQVHGQGLQATLRPEEGPQGISMTFGVALTGSADEVVVDGRVLKVEPETAATAPRTGARPWAWLGLLPVLALLGIASRGPATAIQARHMPDSVANRAERAFHRGRHRRALQLSGRVLVHHPRHAGAASVHALGLLAQDTPRTAATLLEPLLGSSGDCGQISLLHCVSLLRDERHDEARAALSKAIQRFPEILEEIAGTDLMHLHARGQQMGAPYV